MEIISNHENQKKIYFIILGEIYVIACTVEITLNPTTTTTIP